jgi:hypothetical protein
MSTQRITILKSPGMRPLTYAPPRTHHGAERISQQLTYRSKIIRKSRIRYVAILRNANGITSDESGVLSYPLPFAYTTLGVHIVALNYSLIVLTTVVLYLLACDPLPPCVGR